MRNASVAVLMTILLASKPVFADTLDIFSDSQGMNCLVTDNAPGTIPIYIFHDVGPQGTTASQFRVATDAGFTGVYISHQVAPGFLYLGTPPDDYSVAYSSCMLGRFLISTVNYLGFGTSAACSHIWLAAAPTSPIPGEMAVIACFEPLTVPLTHIAVVNFTGSCPAWCIGATEPTSWGKIKALYR